MAVIGIDLGGTKIIGALFEENGTILHQVMHLLEDREGKEVGQLVLDTIDELFENADSIGGVIQAIGVCVPGIADSKTGLVWAPNIQGWDNYPLLKEVKTHVSNKNKEVNTHVNNRNEEVKRHMSNRNINVDIASDRTCYILGEKWKGAAKNSKNALFISVGTGIGVGLLIDGNIVHGHGDIVGAAGWFGLVTPHTEEFEKYGCFESIASGDGIARQAKKLLQEKNDHDKSSLSEEQDYENSLLGEIELDGLTSKDVFAAFDKNDPLAVKVIEQAIEHWGIAAANMISLLNPEIVIWGGGVFGPAEKLIPRIHQEASRWAQPIAMKQTTFKVSELQGTAGLYGAGYLALSIT